MSDYVETTENGLKITYRGGWSGKVWHEFVCEECGNTMDIELDLKNNPDLVSESQPCDRSWTLVDENDEIMLDENDQAQIKPCDGQAWIRYGFQVATFFNRKFPTGYYDRGLGVYVRDENHRKAEMKKRGLMELKEGGDFTIDAQIRERADKHAKVAREYDELEQRNQANGVGRTVKQAQESGQLKDVMKKREVRYHGHGSKPSDAYWRRNK
tara:strand:- start:40 stop:675 length:636 start_codon:yes stop_codon:yes gene_type:complete